VTTPSVVLADGDVLVRDIIRRACDRDEIEVLAEADTADELARLCLELGPDVVVTADCLGDDRVEAVLPAIVGAGSKVIIVTDDHSPMRLTTLLAGGAAGYLFHDAGPAEVAAGVHAVARGDAVLDPPAAAMVLTQWRKSRASSAVPRRPVSLTPREADVLAAMADGMSSKAIANHLEITVKTVENHKIRIFDKLGVRTQAHAITVATSAGLVRPAENASLDRGLG
jgi:DNA-binding NarL/FixJ family response regulator